MTRAFMALAVAATLLAACSGGGGAKPSPTATAAASVTQPSAAVSASPAATATAMAIPTATPSAIDALPGIRLTLGDPKPLPPGMVIYAWDARYEGPSMAIRRYYRDPSGLVRDDTLLESAFDANDPAKARTIVATTALPDGHEIGVTLCHGSCYGSPEPTTIAASTDGGVTWHDLGDFVSSARAAAVTGGKVLADLYHGPWVLAVFPGIEPPPGFVADNEGTYNNALMTAAGGQFLVLYGSGDRRVWVAADAGRTPFATLPIPPEFVGAQDVQLLPAPAGSGVDLIARWGAENGDAYNVGIYDAPEAKWRHVFRYSHKDGLWSPDVAGWVDANTLLVRATIDASRLVPSAPAGSSGGVPALLDVRTGVISPIAEFVPFVTAKAGGPVPFAVATGAFVQVTGAGDCLNVRAAPSMRGEKLGCFADRVLLGRREGQQEAEGRTWLAVRTPDGREGWAAAEFLAAATE